jgi:SRSO17 transposase
VLGLLSGLRRKNCWTIAEQAGDAAPDRMQHLLAAARWDADAVGDDVRAYVIEHLGSAVAVLVVDETGDVKRPPPALACSVSTPVSAPGCRRGLPTISSYVKIAA